jgi:hypothetical protein
MESDGLKAELQQSPTHPKRWSAPYLLLYFDLDPPPHESGHIEILIIVFVAIGFVEIAALCI